MTTLNEESCRLIKSDHDLLAFDNSQEHDIDRLEL